MLHRHVPEHSTNRWSSESPELSVHLCACPVVSARKTNRRHFTYTCGESKRARIAVRKFTTHRTARESILVTRTFTRMAGVDPAHTISYAPCAAEPLQHSWSSRSGHVESEWRCRYWPRAFSRRVGRTCAVFKLWKSAKTAKLRSRRSLSACHVHGLLRILHSVDWGISIAIEGISWEFRDLRGTQANAMRTLAIPRALNTCRPGKTFHLTVPPVRMHAGTPTRPHVQRIWDTGAPARVRSSMSRYELRMRVSIGIYHRTTAFVDAVVIPVHGFVSRHYTALYIYFFTCAPLVPGIQAPAMASVG